jgi:lysophospholipase L1-like esterase
MLRRAAGLLLVLILSAPLARADEPFALGPQETLVFVGDSITAAGGFVRYVEAYLATRFPDRRYRVVSSGRRSETLSGLSEPDHPGPRPLLFERFDDAVQAHAPTYVVAAYGMNDGIYHPFDDERFGCFQTGVGQLITRVRQELKVPLLLLTPPVWDVEARPPQPPGPGESYSWKKPYRGYDEVLERYSAWLTSLEVPGVRVADVHAVFRTHLTCRREDDAGFKLQADSIHPDATGHLLIAMAVLEAWGAPALVSEAVLDAKARRVVSGEVSHVRFARRDVRFTWTSLLPMPVDERWDARSVRAAQLAARLNRHRLEVQGLAAGRYDLVADGGTVGTFTETELGEGVDLTSLPAFPTTAASRRVLARIEERKPGDGGPDPAALARPRTVSLVVRPATRSKQEAK